MPMRWTSPAPHALKNDPDSQANGTNKAHFLSAEPMHYLVPVLTGVVDLSHRTWLQNINESTEKKKKESKYFHGGLQLSCTRNDCDRSRGTTHSHSRTPSFRLSMKLSPILLPVTSWIHRRSSSSFWGSYLPASWRSKMGLFSYLFRLFCSKTEWVIREHWEMKQGHIS